MCNHYRNDIRKAGLETSVYGFEEFSETRLRFDNLPADLFPDSPGLVIRRGDDGRPALETMRWGFPPPPGLGSAPVTNVRNLQSSYWRPWLKPAQRCLVPFTGFSEWTADKPKREIWFAMTRQPAACFAGIWRSWRGTRGTRKQPVDGDHLLFSFLTTAPNGIVAPIHPKAMPVILPDLASQRAWLDAPTEDALQLVRPLPDALLAVEDAAGARRDLFGGA